MSLKTLIFVVLFIILLLILIPLVLWVMISRFAEPVVLTTDVEQSTIESSAFTTLKAENVAFRDAEYSAMTGNNIQARTKYEEALKSAKDADEEAQINFRLALTYLELSDTDLKSAVNLFKSIATSTEYPDVFRAYAVMRLGFLYDVYSFGADAEMLVNETFSGEPFAGLYVPGDIYMSYRNLYEYSSSIKPNALADLRSAKWYIDELGLVEDAVANELAETYIPIILERIKRAQADMKVIQYEENSAALLPAAYTRLGETLAQLSYYAEVSGEPFLSMAESEGITFEAAEEAFQKSLTIRTLHGGHDNFERYKYASSLHRHTSGRDADIVTLMTPVYLEITGKDEAFRAFAASQSKADSWMNKSFIYMADLDSNFKQYLISLGWEETDFTL